MKIGSPLKGVNCFGMADAKRIILTVTTDLNYDQRMQRISDSLQKTHFAVELVGRRKRNSKPLSNRAYKQIRLRSLFESGFLFYGFFNIRLFIFLLFRPVDIICAVDLDTVLAVGLIKFLRPSVKIVFDAHEYFTEVPELKDRAGVQNFWNAIGDKFIPTFDAAYTVGPELSRIFTKRYGLAFETIRNLSVQRPVLEERAVNIPFRLYYQGALNRGRGLEQVIESLSLLDASVQLVIAGEGDLSKYLRELVQDLGLAQRVKFLGYLRPDELQAPLRIADLGLNLLENKGLSYYYSLANKTFDYIQAELPALHMNFPEYKALQADWDCFYLLDKLEPQHIADQISQIRIESKDYNNKKEQCRVAKNVLNWESEAQKVIDIYKQF
jgi:glycosyltransferase involved in cell wall biosynthesis